MLSLERLRSHVVAALGRQPSGANSIEYLVNEAGVAWTNLRSWPYQSNQRREVAVVPGQSQYGLGPDFLEVQALVDPTGYASERALLPLREFEVLRLAYPTSSHPAWSGTIFDGVFGGVPQKVLEVLPVPTVASTLHLVFRRGWQTVSEVDDVVDLPMQLEPAFLAFLEAYARGRERKESLSEVVRVAAESQLVRDALAADGSQISAMYPVLGRIGQEYAQRMGRTSGMYMQTPWGLRLRTPGSSY